MPKGSFQLLTQFDHGLRMNVLKALDSRGHQIGESHYFPRGMPNIHLERMVELQCVTLGYDAPEGIPRRKQLN